MKRDFDDEFNRSADQIGRGRVRQGNRGPDGAPLNRRMPDRMDGANGAAARGQATESAAAGAQGGPARRNIAPGRMSAGGGAARGNMAPGRMPAGATGSGAGQNPAPGRMPAGAAGNGAGQNPAPGRMPAGATGSGAGQNPAPGRMPAGATGSGAGQNPAPGRMPAGATGSGTGQSLAPGRMPARASGNTGMGRELFMNANNGAPVRAAYGGAGYEDPGRTTDGAQLYGTGGRGNGGNRGTGGNGGFGGAADPGNGGRPSGKPAASRSAAQTAKARKRRRLIIMAVAEVLTLVCIFAYAYVAKIMNSIQRPPEWNVEKVKNDVLTPEQKKHMTGYWTIAVFGVDSRDGNVNKGTNADVIMLCNINRDTGEIRLVSVFRDTYLNIGDKGNTYNKINAAYANGGPQLAVAALNRNLDLDIKDYVTFNWKAVADGINMLDGVDVEISKEEFYYINSFITETVEKTGVPSRHLKSAGLNHLDGVQAVAYGRLRLMDTDYARTERQRLIIEKAFAKAKQADLGLLNRILLMEVEQIGTNLTFTDFTNLILDLNKYYIGETGGFPFAKGGMIMGKKGDCVIAQTLESNVTELHEFLYAKDNYVPSNTVKKISAQIMADTGLYKKGGSGAKGSSDKEKTTKETTQREDEWEEEDPESRTESSRETTEGETDELGDPVETSGGETRPGTTRPSDDRPGDGSGGETRPDQTKPSSTKPSQSSSSATEGTIVGPGETSSPVIYPSPGETTTSADEITGPGGKPTTGPGEQTTAPEEPPTTKETVSQVSEGPGETAGGANVPTGGTDGDISVVAPLPEE